MTSSKKKEADLVKDLNSLSSYGRLFAPRSEINIQRPNIEPGLVTQLEWENILAYYELSTDAYFNSKAEINILIEINLWILQFIEPIPFEHNDFKLWYQREMYKNDKFISSYASDLTLKFIGDSLKTYRSEAWITTHKTMIEELKKEYKPAVKIMLKFKKTVA